VKSLFTSRPASYYGSEYYSKPPLESELTLPLVFSNDGYKTACFSSNELIRGKGFENGFQEFLSWSGYYAARKIIAINNFLCQKDNMKFFEFVRKTRAHYPKGEVLINLIEKWLQTSKREPFFLYIHTLDPHWPYYSHDLNMIPEPFRKFEDDLIYTELLDVETKSRADQYREQPEFFNLVGRYDEEICYSDRIFHQLLDILMQQKVLDNTLFILTSDHGEEFLEHDDFSHGHDVWEELIHVPLIIKWPVNDEFSSMPQFVDNPVGLIDIMPTLIDYLELKTSLPQSYGRSLRPVLENKEIHPETHLFSECRYLDSFRAAYREGHLKLRIEFSTDISPMESSKIQVFDLAKDPEEKVQISINEPSISDFTHRGRDFWQKIWELWGDEQRIESDPELKKELEQLKALGYI
jgi:arylsulfatase A-like enzyme